MVFWDHKVDDKQCKYVPSLLLLASCDDYCSMVIEERSKNTTGSDATGGEFYVQLRNAVGAIIDTKVDFTRIFSGTDIEVLYHTELLIPLADDPLSEIICMMICVVCRLSFSLIVISSVSCCYLCPNMYKCVTENRICPQVFGYGSTAHRGSL